MGRVGQNKLTGNKLREKPWRKYTDYVKDCVGQQVINMNNTVQLV